MDLSSRILSTEPPPLTPLMEEAARRSERGQQVHVLAQAMVDYAPPATFLDALRRAAGGDFADLHGYAPDPGRLDLRHALSGYLYRAFGITADPAGQILVTPGANHAAFTALSVLLDEGGEVLVIGPYYFNHAMSITALGGTFRSLPTRAADRFLPRIGDLLDAVSPTTRALILVHPNNPTGICYPEAYLKKLATRMASDSRWDGVWVLVDQTYQEIYFTPERPFSLATVPGLDERVVTISSFSKSMGLAGWRLGFMMGPAAFIEQALKIQDSSVICAAHAAQWALREALIDTDACEAYFAGKRVLLEERRDALLAPLRDVAGLRLTEPDGACFAFAQLPGTTDGTRFVWELLEAAGVLTVPGAPFGDGYRSSIRLSYGAGTPQELSVAGERVAAHVTRTLGRS